MTFSIGNTTAYGRTAYNPSPTFAARNRVFQDKDGTQYVLEHQKTFGERALKFLGITAAVVLLAVAARNFLPKEFTQPIVRAGEDLYRTARLKLGGVPGLDDFLNAPVQSTKAMGQRVYDSVMKPTTFN